jgi:hypothetical protein
LQPSLITPNYRLDMRYASDEQILNTIATLIEAYLLNLTFSQDADGVDFVGVGTPIFNGSPFDLFLIKNNLPRRPGTNETSAQYSRRLLQKVSALPNPSFVTDPADGEFQTHTQTFRFGPTELEGLKIFLTDKNSAGPGQSMKVGNCATCHSLPAFTDFLFHNTGATQEEYDDIHGDGTFNRIAVPGLAARQTNYDAYLPPTPNHPHATGMFDEPPDCDRPGHVDLGLWNVYANPDFPAPQPALAQILPKLLKLPSPQIGHGRINGKHFAISGDNGVPGDTFYILTSKGSSLTASWSVLSTNTFDAQGRFDVSVPIILDKPQAFYKVALRTPTPAEVLPRTIALFKTASVRDLSHSRPYLHTGRMDSLEDVIQFYIDFSRKTRRGEVRNADPEMAEIRLNHSAIAPLSAFLRSLNEDYTD